MLKTKLGKKSWVNILIVVFACIMLVGAIIGVCSYFVRNNNKNNISISASAFSIG